ncbi:MAG: Tyrosine-specific transport protein [Chlamydiae bacterium]|nr:Tyrosine-specific transport protein [Chlamydiota bacterium]
MAATGLLYLEMCIWMDKETNLVSLARKTLGPFGYYFTWVIYLFFFYCLTVAYVVGTQNFLDFFFNQAMNRWVSSGVFALMFVPIIYLGARAVENVNNLFMFGLILTYILFVIMGVPHIQFERLLDSNFKYAFVAFPVIFTAFGYQGVVPSLTFYLKKNVSVIRWTILIGSFIPFIIYIFWEGLVLGIIPKSNLQEALALGENAIYPFRVILGNQRITIMGECFAFFALASSLLGVTLGLRDFLADGLKIQKNSRGRLILCGIIFIPPIIISIYFPNIFLAALGLAGGIGSALILGLLPILMVWSKRYVLKENGGEYQVMGGKPYLIILGLFAIFEITFVAFYSFGWLKL